MEGALGGHQVLPSSRRAPQTVQTLPLGAASREVQPMLSSVCPLRRVYVIPNSSYQLRRPGTGLLASANPGGKEELVAIFSTSVLKCMSVCVWGGYVSLHVRVCARVSLCLCMCACAAGDTWRRGEIVATSNHNAQPCSGWPRGSPDLLALVPRWEETWLDVTSHRFFPAR